MSQRTRLSRRRFLFQLASAGVGSGLVANGALSAATVLRPLRVDNPLFEYPNRDWEKVYRDLYRSDSSFTFLCAPNDTHNCLMNGHVKNGVVTRISPTYGYSKATDLQGNKASQRWDPRCCQKGLALVRRFYGDRRCKRPMVRIGFKAWFDAGFPRDETTGVVDPKYLRRGQDGWVPVSWDDAFRMSAAALKNVAETYTGDEGQRKLSEQGYDPLMVEETGGAGTQVLKFRGGMPPLGMTRVFAQYRLANVMALLDDKIRDSGPEHAVGGRGWDNYSWHTDLPPGHPMVTGQQTLDFDLCNVEHSDLALVWGMNWITTKMPDSHWLTEARMKGTKVVVISAEYSATACKADEVLIVRPGTTPALALGIAQVIMREKLYDAKAVYAETDLPLLVRLDDGQMLRAADVFPGYTNATLSNNLVVLSKGDRQDAETLYTLGRIYQRAGSLREASRILQIVARLAPHHRDVVRRLNSLTESITPDPRPASGAAGTTAEFRRRALREVTAAKSVEVRRESLSADLNQRSRKLGLPALGVGSVVADRYEIVAPLGEGGYAVVFEVWDRILEDRLAMKLFRPAPKGEEDLLRFKQELRLTRRLAHPNIVATYDFKAWQGMYFITMELLEGADLLTVLEETGGRLPVDQSLLLAGQSYAGLGAAHRAGVVHRDIKPANLFVLSGGERLKVMDFGIAKTRVAASALTRPGWLVGTPAYLAPERLESGDAAHAPAVDIYAMGVVLYRMIAGVLPFHEVDFEKLGRMIRKDMPDPPSAFAAEIPASLDELILHLLAKKPEDRPATCFEVQGRIRSILRNELGGLPSPDRSLF